MSEEQKSCKAIANESIVINCQILKKKSDGYQCMRCEGKIDDKEIFQSQECIDSILSESPINIDSPDSNTIRIWNYLRKKLEVNGCSRSLIIEEPDQTERDNKP